MGLCVNYAQCLIFWNQSNKMYLFSICPYFLSVKSLSLVSWSDVVGGIETAEEQGTVSLVSIMFVHHDILNFPWYLALAENTKIQTAFWPCIPVLVIANKTHSLPAVIWKSGMQLIT